MDSPDIWKAFDVGLEKAFGAAFDPVPFLEGVEIGSLAVKTLNGKMLVFNSTSNLFASDGTFRFLHEARTSSLTEQPFSLTYNAEASVGTTVNVRLPLESIGLNSTVLVNYKFKGKSSFVFNSSNCVKSELKFPDRYCNYIRANDVLHGEVARAYSLPKVFGKKPKYVYVAVRVIHALNGIYVAQVDNSSFAEAELALGVTRVDNLKLEFHTERQRNLSSAVQIQNKGFTIGVVWYKLRLADSTTRDDSDDDESEGVIKNQTNVFSEDIVSSVARADRLAKEELDAAQKAGSKGGAAPEGGKQPLG